MVYASQEIGLISVCVQTDGLLSGWLMHVNVTGNAKIAGMSKDLGLVGLQFNVSAVLFSVSRRLITF
jgi:hypothetical protein